MVSLLRIAYLDQASTRSQKSLMRRTASSSASIDAA
jgi:hypothetical protein